MTTAQAAEHYEVSQRCVRQWIAAKHIQAQKVMRDWLIRSGQPRPRDGRAREIEREERKKNKP